jgi:hypothetical protein
VERKIGGEVMRVLWCVERVGEEVRPWGYAGIEQRGRHYCERSLYECSNWGHSPCYVSEMVVPGPPLPAPHTPRDTLGTHGESPGGDGLGWRERPHVGT